MEKNDLHIAMLGTSFSISADEDPEYLENLLERYRIVVENTQKATGLGDPLKAAILTGFLLCDEIEKMKTRLGEEDSRKAEQLTLDLIARIDEVLPEISIDSETPPEQIPEQTDETL
ncbi:MAG: cell division protein ZapA [Treponema sp.]|jgi:cell division protein ZapA (FtsZ GTPase activity inhibitor)|nr:cell division protein ZapA [Treponema sp.]